MIPKKLRSTIAAILTLCPVLSHGWGDESHQAIWALTQTRLSPEARAAMDAVLAGDKLEMTPVWMDRVRDIAKGRTGLLSGDADAVAFNEKFPQNATWHYVDLPLGAESFATVPEFHGAENIVSQINLGLQVLT